MSCEYVTMRSLERCEADADPAAEATIAAASAKTAPPTVDWIRMAGDSSVGCC